MLRTRLLTVTSAAILAATTLTASTANADATLAIGMKWEPVNYTKPVALHSGLTGGGGGMALSGTRLYGWQATSINNYLGAFFGPSGQFGFHLGLDLGYGRLQQGLTDANNNPDVSFFQFGFSLGGKFYILQPRRDRVAPYFYFEFFKYFASVNTNDDAIENDQAGYVASLASPVGISLAVGAEYFFSPAFSVGGEIFGLRYAYSSGRYYVDDNNDFFTKQQFFTMYTAFTLNYRFLITGSVKVREVEGQEQGTPRRPPPSQQPTRRPPSDSAPSAESVD